jgi:outer membrane receptor protein involved in Fe transport
LTYKTDKEQGLAIMTIQHKKAISIPLSQVTKAIKHSLKSKALPSVFLSSMVGLHSGMALAEETTEQQAEKSGIEVIEVTSTKRRVSIQKVPSSVQALSSTALEELGISDFDDYVLMLPSVSYETSGPGRSQIYMRGAADGGDGNASGSQPSVAVYLDEQPVTAIGTNLDIHVYDVERIEALAGPQSTLFGASSQSGTLRIITNKPQSDYTEGGIGVDFSSTEHGGTSHILEGFFNLPITDDTAVRFVGWNKSEGGYIDNVAGTHTSALFVNGGEQVLVENDNAALVEEDFNNLDVSGGRVSLKSQLTDDWELLLGALYQKQETSGVWYHDAENPSGEIGDLEVQRFSPDKSDDDFLQTSLTVTGQFEAAEVIYAASFMERDVEFYSDYSDYSDYNSTNWIHFYGCEYYSTATSDCTSMMIAYNDDNTYKRDTHELRIQSTNDSPLQYIAGLYYEKSSHEYRQEWVMDGMAQGPDFALFGQPNLWYLTDQVREDNQIALFGELTYDFTKQLSATVGGRYFDNESKLNGVSGYGLVAPGFPSLTVDSSVEDSGSIFKANVSYDLTDKRLIYLTWSEGYRPGGINRDATDVVPQTYKPDYVENLEFGWKTMSEDQSLKWNGALYMMDWTDMQLTRYDSSFNSPVGLTINVSEAQILGLETDVTYLLTDDWLLSAAGSYNQAELDKDLVVGTNLSPKGTELPSVPKFKANITSRYNFEMMNYQSHFQLVYSYVGERQSDIFKFTGDDTSVDVRDTLDAYNILNLSLGIEDENWKASLYVSNLTDERAQLSKGSASWDTTTVVNRPRTVGISFSYLFE